MTGGVPHFTPVAFRNWRDSPIQECHAMCVADVDGDGTPEILLTGYRTERPDFHGELHVVRFQPPGDLANVGHTSWRGNGCAYGSAVAAGDVDGDGRTEIVVAGTTYNPNLASYPFRAHLRILRFDGTAFQIADELTWSPDEAIIKRALEAPFSILGASLNAVAIGDIDGDGKPEIICGGSVAVKVGIPALKQEHYNLAWIEVFDWSQGAATRRTPKASHAFWPGEHAWGGIPMRDSFVTDIGCADIDGDGAVEIVSVGNDPFFGQLRSWGLKHGDLGLELQNKAKTDWPFGAKEADANPIDLRLRIDDVSGERNVPGIVTGGAAYVKRWTRTEPWPPHSERKAAYMNLWRYSAGQSFHGITGDLLSFQHSGLDFQRSGCRAVHSADIDKDGRIEVLSYHEAQPPVGGSNYYGYLLAWDPEADWGDPPNLKWKRELVFDIANDAGRILQTFAAGVWAGDIDADGQIETVFSGFYSEGAKRGIYVGVVR